MEQIAINILPKGAKPVCHSSQFDESRQIRFNLFNDDTSYTLSGTETISVLVRKPDGSEVVDSVTNTSDSYVVWDVSTDACELSGVCECELSIVENGIVLGSKNFTMKVEEDAYGGKTIEVRTASGSIATFSTNMVEAFKSLKSDINPVQDLHGYSKPWNGGGGKNKINYNVWKTSSITNGTAVWENNGVKLTATANDCYTQAPNGFPSGAIIPISEGETITLSWEEPTNLDGSVYIFPNNTTTGMVRAYNQQVKKLSYTATSGVTYVTFRFGVSNSGDTIAYKNIQIEKGSQATSFEPYSNICPISGFSALNVTRTGKNLFDKTTATTGAWVNALGTTNPGSNRAYSDYIFIKLNTPYYFKNVEGNSTFTTVIVYDRDKNIIGSKSLSGSGIVSGTLTFTEGYYIRVNTNEDMLNTVQIELGSTASTYEPYNGQTATVNFGQEVYGGVADVTNGKVTITHKLVTLNGSEAWGATGTIYTLSVPDMESGTDLDGITNYIQTVQGSAPIDTVSIRFGYNSNVLYVYQANNYLSGVTDLASFKTYLSNNNLQIWYPLATPIEITTTPETLTAIVGQNNVFADTNGDTTVEYYIEV